MAVINPLEEVSAFNIPHNTVLLGEWEPEPEVTSDGPKIANVKWERKTLKFPFKPVLFRWRK